jgi:CRISPR-associated endonuclease/helicase Cas3
MRFLPSSLLKIKLEDCWAKTDAGTGQISLSVDHHCNVVGSVARAVRDCLPSRCQQILPPGSVTLAAAHDLGKLTPGFQLKCPQWEHYTETRAKVCPDGMVTNHAIISQWHLQQKVARETGFWLVSTGGHHGSYPSGFRLLRQRPYEGGFDSFLPLREELLEKLVQEFGPLPADPGKGKEERVHYLTGFTIFSDWIGSNSGPGWFTKDMVGDQATLSAHARRILVNLGWETRAKPSLAFGAQFGEGDQPGFQPRPVQSILIEAADAPGLYIVEAPMGMGKTEAALAAAYKRWTEGGERGLYFALPTQLTSNKIHDRIHSFLENTIGGEAVQALVHGNAWLREDHTKLLSPRLEEDGLGQPELDHNDTDEVLRWYGSNRKALLAPFGTGTIDQALLAVLPARFAALRYFALGGKVVVIDEVHSYDPYMSALVDRLVRFLLLAGSTVIILSATLTARRRAGLVSAAGGDEADPPASYPLVTKVACGTVSHFPVPDEGQGKVVRLHHHILQCPIGGENFWDGIARQAEAGANVVVIRNTVALAQETYLLLKGLLTDALPHEDSGLLHSRFPQWQREENEGRWTGLLGKEGSLRPSGSILVSTQVLEQSVDIDADLLVTDLAPTDLVLQRIGRLHRHEKPRPTGFENAACHILHPGTDWAGSEKETKAALSPHHFIYPPLTLWQASTYLSCLDRITLPGEIRDILEASSALQPGEGASPALVAFAQEYSKISAAQASTAKARDVFNAVAISDNEGTETRYKMKPSAELILLSAKPVEQGGKVTLLFQHGRGVEFRNGEFSYKLAKALQLNAVRIPAYLVQESTQTSPGWRTAAPPKSSPGCPPTGLHHPRNLSFPQSQIPTLLPSCHRHFLRKAGNNPCPRLPPLRTRTGRPLVLTHPSYLKPPIPHTWTTSTSSIPPGSPSASYPPPPVRPHQPFPSATPSAKATTSPGWTVRRMNA